MKCQEGEAMMDISFEYQYIWILRFLITWDVGCIEISFYDKNLETELYRASLIKSNARYFGVIGICKVCKRPMRRPWCENCEG